MTINTLEQNKNPLLVASYAAILALWAVSQVVLIPYVLHLLLLVLAILYAACHASLALRDESTKDSRTTTSADKETMKLEDAYQFPIVGSISLFSLYLAFKYLNKDFVNFVIGGYFCIVGCLALTMTIAPAMKLVVPKSLHQQTIAVDKSWNHSVPLLPKPIQLQLECTGVDIVSALCSAVVCYFYFQSKPWYLNNVLGICFCLQGIERFSLGTYKIGAILLVRWDEYGFVCQRYVEYLHLMFICRRDSSFMTSFGFLEQRSWSPSRNLWTAPLKYYFPDR
jgi:minor histocompatibility antigen H13